MKYLILLVLLSGCASTAYYDREDVYDQKVKLLEQKKEQGKIGEVEYSNSLLQLVERYIPDHPVMSQAYRERLELASALERGEITRTDFEAQWKNKKELYNARVADYNLEAAKGNVRRQPLHNPFAAMMMMNMLNNQANQFNQVNQFSLQPKHCRSYAFGGAIESSCY
jgi:hypothetical protein